MLGTIFGRQLQGQRLGRLKAPNRIRTGLQVESLEDRTVPAVLLVDLAHYTTIQAAINAANPGDQIRIAPGTYTEQLALGAGKDRVTLNPSSGNGVVTVQAPAVLDTVHHNAVVDISTSQNVRIIGLTILGNANTQFGIRVDAGGSAFIRDNNISNILAGDAAAILVGRDQTDDNTTGTATILHNTISNYTKAGIVVDNAGSSALVSLNSVTGIGPDPNLVQYGIQVSHGANADVRGNTISGNVNSANNGIESGGILVWAAGAATEIENNKLTNNQDGIFLFQAVSVDIEHNHSFANSADGIVVVDSRCNEIVHNEVNNNGRDGISVYGGDPYTNDDGSVVPVGGHNDIGWNSSHDNAGNGFHFDYTATTNPNGVSANNAVVFNSATNNGGDGFLLVGASHNLIWQNRADRNQQSGFAFTAASDGNLIAANHADFNQQYGFAFLGNSDGNLVARNIAFHNAAFGFNESAGSDNTFVCNVAFGNGLKGKMNFSSNIEQDISAHDFEDFNCDWGVSDDCLSDLLNWGDD